MTTVVFDMDGTLSERDHILSIYCELGLEKQAKEIHSQYKRGELTHEELWQEGTDLLKGVSIKKLKALSKKIPLKSEAIECIKTLRENGYDVFVLTDGYKELIKDKVPCEVYGKELTYDEVDCVNGLDGDLITTSLMKENGKTAVLNAMQGELIVVDDHPERIGKNYQVINPNEFGSLNAVVDYILITELAKPNHNKNGGRIYMPSF